MIDLQEILKNPSKYPDYSVLSTGSSNYILTAKKKNVQNPLYGKTYKELRQIVRQMRDNLDEEIGRTCICPICGKSFIKGNLKQFTCSPINMTKSTIRKGCQERCCTVKFNDAKKQLRHELPNKQDQELMRIDLKVF